MPENFEINFDVLKQNLEFLDEGLLIVDSGLKIVIANQRFVELLDIPERMKQSGTTIEEIFLYKAERGNYGPDQTEVLVASKLARARLMQA
ncbi:MAG: hybrid sensor histidine kinase/response regulator, partial [Alphaproteobacteria bacterium]|nr:hybrid sensor histidine kinase/response regulator [Alphaproteobacteria bacterium]